LGIGDWAQSPIPNPQSPIPMLKHFFIDFIIKFTLFNKDIKIKISAYKMGIRQCYQEKPRTKKVNVEEKKILV